MPAPGSNYFRYFPAAPEASAWGVAVTAAGFTRIPPHTPYPPTRHPTDHHFEWSRGRVLEALQIVLITRGRGIFETRGSRQQPIEAGAAFMLFPGVWHRYRPDPATGWEESWVELHGDTVQRLLRRKVFLPSSPVLPGGVAAGLESHLQAVHACARQARPGFDAELTARGFATLTAWAQAITGSRRQTRLGRAVVLVERHLSEHLTEPINVEELARSLGVAYSNLRQAFKVRTGYAPWQYLLHLRLVHARRQLADTDATLDEIATRLGFSSAFHLSAAFKKAYGIAPAHWRQKAAAPAASPRGKGKA